MPCIVHWAIAGRIGVLTLHTPPAACAVLELTTLMCRILGETVAHTSDPHACASMA